MTVGGGRLESTGRSGVDRLDDLPWTAAVPAATTLSSRRVLVFTLVATVLFVATTALPWFTSAESPAWTPYSHWLDLGWGPGTQRWGFLPLAVAGAVGCALAGAIRNHRPWLIALLPLLAAALVVVTSLETTAHLSVNPGPLLHADYGAWTGDALALCVLAGAGVGAACSIRERRRRLR